MSSLETLGIVCLMPSDDRKISLITATIETFFIMRWIGMVILIYLVDVSTERISKHSLLLKATCWKPPGGGLPVGMPWHLAEEDLKTSQSDHTSGFVFVHIKYIYLRLITFKTYHLHYIYMCEFYKLKMYWKINSMSVQF